MVIGSIENELKRKIKKNWPKVANDVKEIRKALKQFVLWSKAVSENDCIKMLLG